MSGNKTHIDDLFKQGLAGAEQPLNGTEWDRLYADLHPPKKRILWWWFVLPALVVSAVGFFIFINGGTTAEHTATLPTVEVPGINTQKQNQKSSSQVPGKLEQKDDDSGKGETNNPSSVKPNKGVVNPFKFPTNRKNIKQLITSNPSAERDSSKKIQADRLVELLPRPLQGIGEFIAPIIPGLIYAVTHPPFKSPPMPNAIPKAYLGFTASGSLLNQNASSSTTSDYSRLKELNENAALKPAFSIDLGTSWKGIEIGSGIGYQQKGQQLNSTFTHQLYDSIPYIDLKGNVTWIPWNHRDTTITKPGKNPRFNYVLVPFNIGKSFDLNRKTSFEVGVNGQVHWLLGASGYSLSSSLRPLELKAAQFNRLNMSLGGYSSLVREINTQTDVIFRVNLTTDLSNMMNNKNFKQRFTAYGLGVSVRYKLY